MDRLRTFPCLDLTDLDLTQVEQRVRRAVRDVTYVGIGFSVLAAQRAMVRRREFLDALAKDSTGPGTRQA
jgi:hypothetical protein